MSQVAALVRTVLQERGVPASDEEIEALVAAYPAFTARVEMLYAVADAHEELQTNRQGASVECQP